MWIVQRTSLLLLVVALIGFDSCRNSAQRAKIKELRTLAGETPKFPDFKQVHYEDISRSSSAVVTYYYKSAGALESVWEFYKKELSARGWIQEKQEGWDDTAGPLTFRKGNYKIVVTEDRILMWQYTVDFTWRQ